MIDINELKGRNAIALLQNYEGINPYIKDLKNKLLKDGKVKLTEGQALYINDFHNVPPQVLNKVVLINPLLGESLKEKENLSFVPERILIQAILADQEKTYHVYGKVKKNQKYAKMYFLPKTMVLDDPYFTECDVKIDWDKYENLDKGGRHPYEHQKSGIEFLTCRNGAILADDMGLGKAQPLDSKILTPNGWTTMGKIQIGDNVIGSNGLPTKVTGVFPQGDKEIYQITFTDGSKVECCDEHLWSVQTTNHKKRNNGFITKSLKELYYDLTYGTKGNVKWYIPMVKPVEYSIKKINLNPYLLGCLLGDGGFSGHNVKFSTNDTEIIDELLEYRLPLNHKFKKINDCDYHLVGYKQKNEVIRELKNLNLMGLTSDLKFIPNDYKYNAGLVRILILQGLLDTDGYISENGTIQYYSVSKNLSDDVKELVQSLGGVARQRIKQGKYKLPDGKIKECKECFILTINLPENITPFRLKRKNNRVNKNKKYLPSRGIKSIEYFGEMEAQCISVEAEDSLYVTDDYVLTHNTYQSILAALVVDAKKVLVVCPASVKISWQREIESFGQKGIIVSGSNWPDVGRFTIINYDILKNFHTLGKPKKDDVHYTNILEENYDLVILDEAHKIKNPKAQRTQLINDIVESGNVERVWLLTGTPIANKPMDFFNLLKLVKSPLGGNWKFYAQRYCDAKRFYKKLNNGRTKQIWITDGASNLTELGIRTKNTLLRRLKTEVLDMPDKTITTLYHDLSKRGWNEYENLWEEYLEKRTEEGKRTNSLSKDLVELGLLRKFIAMEVIPKTVELANDAIEQGQKVVIFTTFTDELEELAEEFGSKCVIHNGRMSVKAKQDSIDKFQNNKKTKIFIGNITSAGVGITLTEGTVVIFNSFSWVPGDNEQAEDRCIFGDQWVMTDDGYKMIQEIEIGDKVYTHKGNFKNVIDKTSKLERKKLRYDINAFGYNNNLSVTHDHKLYVYDKIAEEFIWIEAKDLNILSHSLTIRSESQPISRLEELKIPSFKSKYFKNNHNVLQSNGRLVTLPKSVLLTNDLLYAFGFYIADGWCSISDNKSDTINVCQKITNAKMYDASEYIIDIIKKGFKIDKHSSYIDKNGTKTCTIHSSEMANLFKMWFGKDVYSKQLPYWVDYLNNEQLKHLLDGYYHGDGYQRKNTQQATTASLKLISQLVRYNANIGRSVSLSNKDVNNYSIEYSLNGVENKRINQVGNYITYPIKSIKISKPKRGEERVYDLSVEDDHSFVVGNYNVHNCFRIGQKNNVSVYYQLFRGTISLAMWYSLMSKQKNIDKILNAGDKHSERLSKLINELEENGLEL